MTLNRCAAPADFDGQTPKDRHPLVTEEILDGQHPQRAWEYSQALFALEHGGWDFNESRDLLFADIGGASSQFWKTLTTYTNRPITRVDPNHEWDDDNEASVYFRETLRSYASHSHPDFDAVFCLSVIEHVPSDDLVQFERDLCSLVKPGGLLVLTCDAGPAHPDVYHFNWMRKRIYTSGGLLGLAIAFQGYGLEPLTPVDFTWHGPTVYDYGTAILTFVKKG